MDEPEALIYLAQEDEGKPASLRAWLLNDQLELMISPSVDEYRLIPWPSPGILYSVASGPDAGIWLSKSR